jgi:hypothetical protein
MKLMAASAAAVLAPSLERAMAAPAAAARTAVPSASRALSPALRREIAAQKKSLADTLRVIRDYELSPGSRPAFVFRAERRDARRGRP